MSEDECSESNDLHQEWPTHGTIPGGSPIRQTRAKLYPSSNKNGEGKRVRKDIEYFEDEAILPQIRRPT